jgi:tetratricopeptide (TPR) repeat protein
MGLSLPGLAAPAAPVSAADGARGIVTEVRQALSLLSDETEAVRDALVFELATLQISLGDLENAAEAGIYDPLYKDRIQSRLAAAYAEKQDFPAAEKALFKIVSPLYAVDARIGIAEKYLNEFVSQKYFAEALNGCSSIPSAVDREERLAALALAEMKTQHLMAAVETLKTVESEEAKTKLLKQLLELTQDAAGIRNLKEVAQILGIPAREEVLGAAAAAEAKAGLAAEADETLSGLKTPYVQAAALAETAQAEAVYGLKTTEKIVKKLETAHYTARKIADDALKSELLSKIAQVQMRVWATHDALQSFQHARLAASGVRRDLKRRAGLMTGLGRATRENGFHAESVQLFQEAHRTILSIEGELFEKVTLLNALGKALAEKRDPETKQTLVETAALAQGLEEAWQRSEVDAGLGDAYWDLGETEEAGSRLTSAVSTALKIPEPEKSSDAVIRIALIYVKHGLLTGAAALVPSVPLETKQGELLSQACALHAENGNAEEALNVARSENNLSTSLRGRLGAARGMLKKEEDDKQEKLFLVSF